VRIPVKAFVSALSIVLAVHRAAAQQGAGFLDVGGEREQVMRVLQLTGDVAWYPWTIRGLSPAELDRIDVSSTRAAAMLPLAPKTRHAGLLRYALLPVQATGYYNSAFPYGYNDGPVWQGKGLTGAVSAGVAARLGPLSVQLEPMVFEAQNAAFTLMPTGTAGAPYLDAFHPTAIDHPQRFGPSTYKRVDLGQSSVRLDVGPLAAEISTANQWWGPAQENPMILGNNAPGFFHGGLGTSHPLNVWIGSVHGRVVYGRLEQSAYSPDQGNDSIRFMSGFVAEFTPRGVPGLELGGTRFFHSPWPTNGLSHAPWSRPFEGILKSSLESSANTSGDNPDDNQLASLFMRWAFPGHGLELYGEYGREDHNVDVRDLIQEPDHESGYLVGLERSWKKGETGVTALRAEVINTRISPLQQGRGEGPWYVHGPSVVQGHTDLGQILGSEAAYGGGGALLAIDRYRGKQRITLEWARLMRSESDAGLPQPSRADVEQTFSVLWSNGRGPLSTNAGVTGVWDLNRNFERDRFNLNLSSRVSYTW